MFTRLAAAFLSLLLVSISTVRGQTPAPAAPAETDKPPIKAEELEQILAPIALYPDSLLSQVLMASTYPLEIVESDRWAKANAQLKGDALAKELEKQTWDASVKSLVNFPEVLGMMSEKLDITMKIGDAFIEDQTRVMNTVQSLRAKAQAAGNLQSSEQQKVVVGPAPPPPADQTVVVQSAPPPTQIIKIESSSPEVVYVPQYNPTVVYGSWPYPSYPPPPYYPPRPPGYVASNMISFGVGVACGAAWGYAWGGCNWGGGDVDIDVNRNTNFNTNIDRSKAQANIDARKTNVQSGTRANSFQHDPAHRKGAAYRDPKTAQKFGGADSAKAAQARQQYRGRADAGAQQLRSDGAGAGNRAGVSDRSGAGAGNRAGAGGAGADRSGAGANRPGAGADRPGAGTADRAGAGADRPGAGTADRAGAGAADRAGPSAGTGDRSAAGAGNRAAPQDRSGPAGTRDRTPSASGARNTGNSSSALGGIERGGSGARAESQRGQASRSASPSRSAGGGGGGGGRSGGGGGRR
jgi:hypothetical protein